MNSNKMEGEYANGKVAVAFLYSILSSIQTQHWSCHRGFNKWPKGISTRADLISRNVLDEFSEML